MADASPKSSTSSKYIPPPLRNQHSPDSNSVAASSPHKTPNHGNHTSPTPVFDGGWSNYDGLSLHKMRRDSLIIANTPVGNFHDVLKQRDPVIAFKNELPYSLKEIDIDYHLMVFQDRLLQEMGVRKAQSSRMGVCSVLS